MHPGAETQINLTNWPPELEELSEGEEQLHSEESLRLKKLLRQWDIPVDSLWTAGACVPGDLCFQKSLY